VKKHIQNTVTNTQYVTIHKRASTVKAKTEQTNQLTEDITIRKVS
jgi:hypothetical protein